MTMISDVWMSSSIVPWRRLGFADFPISQPDGSTVFCLSIAGLGFRFLPELSDPSASGSCVSGWTLVADSVSGDRDLLSVDGIETRVIAGPVAVPQLTHALNVASIDHLVITTGSLDRTCGAITEQLGLPLKRIRDAGHGVRQGFHRAGSIILEIVERPDLAPETAAEIWGVVFVVEDLDAAVTWLGPDAIGAPRDAVQSGRRIASVKKEVGLGLPVALMSPHVR
ncbi:MAG: hypothetical protein O3B91_07325 [Actinomycetota bacterium]|nr:hypothetical protein [Actinomycetota bacterium]MDA3019869.1 hypothetical protein [Actinomycetota bacterium]